MAAIDWSVVNAALGNHVQPQPQGTSSGIDWGAVKSALATPSTQATSQNKTPPVASPNSVNTPAQQPSLLDRMFGPYVAAAKGAYRGVQDVTDSVVQGAASLADMALGNRPNLSGLVTGNNGTLRAAVDAQVQAGHQAFDQQYGGAGINNRIAQNLRFGANVLTTAPVAELKLLQGAGMLPKLVNGTTQGAVQGGLLSSQNNMSGGTNAAIGAAAGAAGPLVSGLLTRPVVRPEVQTLLNNGVTPTVGQIMGGSMKTLEDKMTSMPLVGNAITSARQNAVQQLNRAALNRAVAPIGGTVDTIGRDGLADAGQQLSKAYDDTLSQMSFQSDPIFNLGLNNLQSMASQMPPPQANQFNNILQNHFFSRLTPAGTMNGEALQGVQSELRRLAGGYQGDASFDNRQLGDAVGEISNLIDHSLARTNPPNLSQGLQNANQGWANYVRLRDASSRLGTDQGVFSPAQLQSAVRAGDSSVGKGDFARGNALMQDLSDAGVSVLGKNYPDSGTAGRTLLGATAAAVPTAILKPDTIPYMVGAGLLGGAGALPYTSYGARFMSGLLTDRPQLVDQLGQGLFPLSPAAAPVALGYGGNN